MIGSGFGRQSCRCGCVSARGCSCVRCGCAGRPAAHAGAPACGCRCCCWGWSPCHCCVRSRCCRRHRCCRHRPRCSCRRRCCRAGGQAVGGARRAPGHAARAQLVRAGAVRQAGRREDAAARRGRADWSARATAAAAGTLRLQRSRRAVSVGTSGGRCWMLGAGGC